MKGEGSMNTWMSLRRLVAAAVLSVAVPLPAAGQEAQAETPQIEARAWAMELIQKMRMHKSRDEAGDSLALQPLDPEEFRMLTDRQQRQLYEWLLGGFGDSALGQYSLTDAGRLPDISRAMEETGGADSKES